MCNVRIRGLLVGLIVIFIMAEASASGFFVARFGGEHGHPTTDNPTAMYYNPALSLPARASTSMATLPGEVLPMTAILRHRQCQR